MKPLTRYALESYVQGWHERHEMTADPGGKWYAKDEADARIRHYQDEALCAEEAALSHAQRVAELEAEVVEWRGQRDQWAGLCVTMERRIKQLDEEAQDYSDRLEKGEFLDRAKNDRIYRLQAKCAELEAERDAARADAERMRGHMRYFVDNDFNRVRKQRDQAYTALERIAGFTLSQFHTVYDMADACVHEAVAVVGEQEDSDAD